MHNSQEIPEGLKKRFDQNWLGLTCLQIIQIISKNYEKIQRGQRSSLELRQNIHKSWAQDLPQEVFDWSEIWGFDFDFQMQEKFYFIHIFLHLKH